MWKWLQRAAPLALVLLSSSNPIKEVTASLPLRPTPEQVGQPPRSLVAYSGALLHQQPHVRWAKWELIC